MAFQYECLFIHWISLVKIFIWDRNVMHNEIHKVITYTNPSRHRKLKTMFSSECSFISRIDSCKAEFFMIMSHYHLLGSFPDCDVSEQNVTLANSLLLYIRILCYISLFHAFLLNVSPFDLIVRFATHSAEVMSSKMFVELCCDGYRYETCVGPNINTPYAIKFGFVLSLLFLLFFVFIPFLYTSPRIK